MALFILISHCAIGLEKVGMQPLLIIPINKASTLIVAYFFVMSGYGLASRYNQDNRYLKSFLVKKIGPIVAAMLVYKMVCGIMLLLQESFEPNAYGITELFWAKSSINWYLYAICFAYTIFYISYRSFSNQKTRVVSVIFGTMILTSLAWYFRAPRVYFISEMAFPMGVVIAEYGENIIRYVFKNRLKMLVLFFGITAVSLIGFLVDDYTIGDYILHNTLILPFYTVIFIACNYYSFNNRVLKYLSVISFEIYLYQFPVFSLVRAGLIKYGVYQASTYIAISLIVTIILASVLHPIHNIVGKKIAYMCKKDVKPSMQ